MSRIKAHRIETDLGTAFLFYRTEVIEDRHPNLPNGWRCEVNDIVEWIEDDNGKRLSSDDPLFIEALIIWDL